MFLSKARSVVNSLINALRPFGLVQIFFEKNHDIRLCSEYFNPVSVGYNFLFLTGVPDAINKIPRAWVNINVKI